ncbi:GNAT family N-acetyltransferase [Selenomonas montiformis]|uniref:GNAT family N-acetyltransferase n=1 Tax=Selenomonas montiformis TaxID=2652285 RepID=A0A6I2UX65_9FIRM|nr:GNAT family N-acetyltransferase [Selenomonas montiformis]MSV24710.1 GNAT family N-acetyltransferase [Selenomonas montiformis]
MKSKYFLRELKEKDAPFMLEWMHDEDVIHDLQNNFAKKTIEDCLLFIKKAKGNREDLHLAIVDMNDEYMGTTSLKHISDKTAEFAITIREKAMGTGCSRFAMKEIIELAFRELDLVEVYWCVSPKNQRAVRFYEKNEYERIPISEMIVTKAKCMQSYSEKQMDEYIWYHVVR